MLLRSTHFKLPSKASSSNDFCFIFFYRVNDYINNGLSNNLVDPDGGVNVQKKRLKLGLIQEVRPTCNADFPADGFQVGISCVPRIDYNHIWKYLIEDVALKTNSCMFVSSARGTHRDTVLFDSAFWENILPRLESFYFDHVFPELVYPRILTGESRWNKDLQFPRLA